MPLLDQYLKLGFLLRSKLPLTAKLGDQVSRLTNSPLTHYDRKLLADYVPIPLIPAFKEPSANRVTSVPRGAILSTALFTIDPRFIATGSVRTYLAP